MRVLLVGRFVRLLAKPRGLQGHREQESLPNESVVRWSRSGNHGGIVNRIGNRINVPVRWTTIRVGSVRERYLWIWLVGRAGFNPAQERE